MEACLRYLLPAVACALGLGTAWDASFAAGTRSAGPAAAPAAAPANPPAVAPAAPASAPAGALDEVLVTGERPGPGMWRVSKGGHDLWILATLEPLPKNMTWRSRAVEERIAASQRVLAPPQVNPSVGFFRGLTLLPSLLRARKSPDGRTLEQVLPHDLYIRWLALRVKYLGRGDDEHLRPMLAALDLYMHALEASDLTTDDSVWKIVEQTARKHNVTILPVTLDMPIKDPKGSIRELDDIPQPTEVRCLETAVTRLETDLPTMRRRANLWSLGDIEGLRAMPYPDERIACFEVLFNLPKLGDQLTEVRQRLTDLWLADADDALTRYESSFAVLPLSEMLKPDGWLEKLRDKGCAVQEP